MKIQKGALVHAAGLMAVNHSQGMKTWDILSGWVGFGAVEMSGTRSDGVKCADTVEWSSAEF